jgi:hypothetical protein
MSDVTTRMKKLIEAQEPGAEGEEAEPGLLDLAQHVALGADALGITDEKELAGMLKKLAMKPSVLKRGMKLAAQTGKATKLARAATKAARD